MRYIAFPGLGLKFFIDPVAFRIGSLSIYWYGIIIGVGFLAAMTLALLQCKKYGIKQDDIIDVTMWGVIFAMIGAKLYYVIFNFSIYQNNPIEIFTTWQKGLAIYGGIIGASVGAFICCKLEKKDFMKIMDFAIVFFPLGQAIGRWANFVNQEAYGKAVQWQDMPWRMEGSQIIEGAVHPTFLYESLWCIAVFIFLLWFRNKAKLKGEVLSAYLIAYGFGRFFIEGLRTDSLMVGPIRISQLLSAVLVILVGAFFIFRRYELKHPVFKDDKPLPVSGAEDQSDEANLPGDEISGYHSKVIDLTGEDDEEESISTDDEENIDDSPMAEGSVGPIAEESVEPMAEGSEEPLTEGSEGSSDNDKSLREGSQTEEPVNHDE